MCVCVCVWVSCGCTWDWVYCNLTETFCTARSSLTLTHTLTSLSVRPYEHIANALSAIPRRNGSPVKGLMSRSPALPTSARYTAAQKQLLKTRAFNQNSQTVPRSGHTLRIAKLVTMELKFSTSCNADGHVRALRDRTFGLSKTCGLHVFCVVLIIIVMWVTGHSNDLLILAKNLSHVFRFLTLPPWITMCQVHFLAFPHVWMDALPTSLRWCIRTWAEMHVRIHRTPVRRLRWLQYFHKPCWGFFDKSSPIRETDVSVSASR